MNDQKQALSTDGYVPVTDLAAEFGKDLRTVTKWLLQHDIRVSRWAVLCESTGQRVAVLTKIEAHEARNLHQYGVLLRAAAK